MSNSRVPRDIGAYDHALAARRPAGRIEARLDRLAARMPFAAYAAWAWVRRQYDGMPGPHWLRLGLVVFLLLTPGPDELLIPAIPRATRAVKVIIKVIKERMSGNGESRRNSKGDHGDL